MNKSNAKDTKQIQQLNSSKAQDDDERLTPGTEAADDRNDNKAENEIEEEDIEESDDIEEADDDEPPMTEKDLEENDLSIDEADKVEWDTPPPTAL